MVNNSKYFYLSGLLSLSLFALFLVLFITIVLQQEKLKQFALKKDNYISVSINLDALSQKTFKKEPKKEQKKPQPKKEIKKEIPKVENKPVPVPKPAPPKPVPNLSDLFATVEAAKVVPKKEAEPDIDKKLLAKLAKPTEKKEVTQDNTASSIIKKIEITSESASTSPDVNEYLAKIQAIIYEQFFPPMNSAGESAVISIRLDQFGKLVVYRVLRYSGDDLFNAEVDRLERRLKRLTFVKHPEGKTERIKIILTSQE
ncbi:MAG: hypothetical protein DSZ03_04095 [Sulfurimonas sp.]|nr:MAG: hypothetical protein DSZ03_04095 [Sulfurimonas sp.]